MAKKSTIFNSKSEMKVFIDLGPKWDNLVGIHDHIPVANVVNIPKLKDFSEGEKNYLWKKSFDFVVTSKEKRRSGEPLLVIEFDGIGQGYSYDGKYVQTKEIDYDPNRKWKIDVKMRACQVSDVPLVVVSDLDVSSFDGNLTILDGIIGDVLAQHEFRKRFMKELKDVIKDLDDPEDIQHAVDHYGIEREMESKMKYNPIYSEAVKLEYYLFDKKFITLVAKDTIQKMVSDSVSIIQL